MTKMRKTKTRTRKGPAISLFAAHFAAADAAFATAAFATAAFAAAAFATAAFATVASDCGKPVRAVSLNEEENAASAASVPSVPSVPAGRRRGPGRRNG